jgi:hypothetical protein
MNFVAIVIVIFLANGAPAKPLADILTLDQPCNEDLAIAMVRAAERERGENYQDYILWRCDSVTSPGPVRRNDL